MQRWNHHLRPGIKRDAWTEEEEAQLVALHRQLDNRWSDIARQLEGVCAHATEGARGSRSCRAVGCSVPWRRGEVVLAAAHVHCAANAAPGVVACRASTPGCLPLQPSNAPHPS
jgi:hypothetical protein